MDLGTPGYVKLGGTARKDSFVQPQRKEAFDEESYDMEIIGGPKDTPGGEEEGE
jgi:hypothetical protein